MLFRLFIFAVLMLDGYSRIETPRREYSMIELNHRYNEFGQPCYSQIIIWQWDGSVGRHDVVAWWLVEPDKLEKLPQRRGQFWQVDHRDKDNRQFRIVAKIYRETKTTTDPERDNKLLKPENLRQGIR
jgi:hypothetical protein